MNTFTEWLNQELNSRGWSQSELALQRILGHQDLQMTSRYARLAQSDVQRSHKGASPLDHWKV